MASGSLLRRWIWSRWIFGIDGSTFHGTKECLLAPGDHDVIPRPMTTARLAGDRSGVPWGDMFAGPIGAIASMMVTLG
jgi:hypothetical protein